MGRRARSLRLVGGLVQLLLHGLDLLGEVVVGLLDLRRQLGVGLVHVRGDLLRQLLALGHAGADGGLQAVAQLAGLLLHLGVRLAQVGGGLLDVGARRLQRLLGLAVGVVDLQERGSVTVGGLDWHACLFDRAPDTRSGDRALGSPESELLV